MRVECLSGRSPRDLGYAHGCARHVQRQQQTRMLRVGRDDLVARAAARARRGRCCSRRSSSSSVRSAPATRRQRGDLCTDAGAQREDALEPLAPAPSLLLVVPRPLLHRRQRRPRESGPSVPALRYAKRSSTGKSARASSNVTRPPARQGRGPRGAVRRDVRRSAGHATAHPHGGRARARGRCRSASRRRSPIRRVMSSARVREWRTLRLKSPAQQRQARRARPSRRRTSRRGGARRPRAACRRSSSSVEVRRRPASRPPSRRRRTAWHTRRSMAHASRAARPDRAAEPARAESGTD